MNNPKFGRSKRNKENKGFYLALVGCLAAIVAVTWTAVGNLNTLSTDDSASSGDEFPGLIEDADTVPNQYIDGFDWNDDATNEYNSVMDGLDLENDEESDAAAAESSGSDEANTAQANTQPIAATASSAPPESSETEANTAASSQSYMLPLSNEIQKEFSGNELVYSMTFGDWRVHEGVDFKGKKEDMVRSCGDGTVADIIKDPLYGTTVIINHGDFEAHYCGLVENVSVEKGQQVSIGDDIGNLGDIPCETVDEIHLHFGVKKGGKWIDPVAALRSQTA